MRHQLKQMMRSLVIATGTKKAISSIESEVEEAKQVIVGDVVYKLTGISSCDHANDPTKAMEWLQSLPQQSERRPNQGASLGGCIEGKAEPSHCYNNSNYASYSRNNTGPFVIIRVVWWGAGGKDLQSCRTRSTSSRQYKGHFDCWWSASECQ